MPDTAALKLINVNIDSIQAEVVECKTNTGYMRESNIEKEMHAVEKCCANTDADSKIKHGTNGHSGQDNANKTTNYFFSSANVEADKGKSIKLMWEIHNTFGDVLMVLGALKAHSLYSLSQTANHIRYHLGHIRRINNIWRGWTSSSL